VGRNGEQLKTWIVGDIGINHQGKVENATKLIDVAVDAGFDAVKFQKRNPELYPETPKNSPILGVCTLREHRRALELTEANYNYINEYCKNRIEWFASCWDLDSVEFILQYKPLYWKIASACITDFNLIASISQQHGHIIMSTGMSDEIMVNDALELIREYKHDSEITLLHCCGEYPVPKQHVNLRRIPRMMSEYPFIRIGYSSHDGGVPISVTAVGLGAKVIEVHITLDRMMPGSDHAASLEKRGMQTLVEHIRVIEDALGVSEKQYYAEERKKRESLTK
jgi:sialic acid synthase SpsE